MKKILGLDLGTTSIGWAYVNEAENENEVSSIVKLGVRVNPLSVDEQQNFEKGKPITTNSSRTLARSARRNLQRYKQRREFLVNTLIEHNWITNETILTENSANSTFETYSLRARAKSDQLKLEEFARVLLMINKKRGYKSSRKVNNSEEGQLIDGMDIAIKLYHEELTPGQLTYQLLKEGKKKVPDFYRSDLDNELEKVWNYQKEYYPEIFTDSFRETIKGKGQKTTASSFWTTYNFNTAENKGTRDEKKIQIYKWRSEALFKKLELDQVALIISEINGQLYNSSGYLGAISDRSKELFFNKQTVGEYLYNQIQKNSHASLKNQVFYRRDYLDEFESLWEKQATYYPLEMTRELKDKIRDAIIFYQRKLKSQKGLVSFCEFEHKEIDLKGKKKIVGLKVVPKSSLLFQEFKIWQQLHNVKLKNKQTREVYYLTQEQKDFLFEELNLKGNLTSLVVLKLIEDKPKEWELNYSVLEGNRTNESLYNAYIDMLDTEGYNLRDELKIKLNKDAISLSDLNVSAFEIKEMISRIFKDLGVNTSILEFNAELKEDEFEKQLSYQLWHVLYSYEEDNSVSGMDRLYELLQNKFGFSLMQAKILAKTVFQPDYGNVSSKFIRNIYSYIKENEYSDACELAGYRHSKNSFTKEELTNRILKDKLEILSKNSLRNPVVEKILNQMINVVNTLIDTENIKLIGEGKVPNFRFDEIRIELSRELKKNAKEREELTKAINSAKTDHEKIIKILQKEDGIKNPSRNDIIRYKLYQELKNNGYKNLYTNEYIERKDLFSKKYDVDHIIPQSRLFDDSFSNKTIIQRKINIEKGNKTAYDYISETFGDIKLEEFSQRVESLSTITDGISKAKFKKLLIKGQDIGDGFIQRDLRDTQYIAKKAKNMLFEISPSVISTSGSVTNRLRSDWGLVDVMKELNLPKYRESNLTQWIDTKDGNKKEIIIDWTKRNDHRHHAMDALTIAFTKPSHIQYLNHLSARNNVKNEHHIIINNIEQKELIVFEDKLGNKKRKFKEPTPKFREIAKQFIEQILISHKAKNKVVTKNKNIIKGASAIQEVLTPRGQLHKETVYRMFKEYATNEEKVSAKFDSEFIKKVTNSRYRELLLERLSLFDNDPKKAFTGKNSLLKSPIYLDNQKTDYVPEKVQIKWLEEAFSIRKEVSPDLKIDKVIDKKIKLILKNRLDEFNGDSKRAFSDLDINPIWLNKSKGIKIKRVAIYGVKNAEALHSKKNHLGEFFLDKNNNQIPVDYVNTGNNHHVAIYEDEKGNLQESVVPFFMAVERVNQGLPIIDKLYNHSIGWKFLFTMKQNELFLFPKDDFTPSDYDLLDDTNNKIISKHLFRVQKFTIKDYVFRHHLETNVDDIKELKSITWRREGLNGIKGIIKVRTNHLGQIIHIGEY